MLPRLLRTGYASVAQYKALTLARCNTSLPRKAVIPIAGLGRRMGLQSTVTSKAFLPLFRWTEKRALVVEPLLATLIRQLVHEGSIEKICIVAATTQMPTIKSFLREFSIVTKADIQVVIQEQPFGFGDAVRLCKDFAGGEPCLVSVGDHVYTSGCVSQLISAYHGLLQNGANKNTTALTGACWCTRDEALLTGLLKSCNDALLVHGVPVMVDYMAEKPKDLFRFESPEAYANKYPSQLGLDIIPPSIFAVLERLQAAVNPEEELELRAAMRSLIDHRQLYCCLIKGTRMDVGNPKSYLKTLQSTSFEAVSDWQ